MPSSPADISLYKYDGRQLCIPRLSWLIQSGQQCNTCSYASCGAWNMFSTGLLSQLTAGDTLVVQERTIALLKK